MAGQPIDVFIRENPQSPFGQLLSRKEQHHQLRGLSNSILKRILPADDMNSKIVQSLFRELLATHLFGNILATCSDPDFINSWIVTYLTSTPDTSTTENGTSSLPSSSANDIRSLVEKATEDVMAAEQEDLTIPTVNSTPEIDHVKLPPTTHTMTTNDMVHPSSTTSTNANPTLKHSPPITPESLTNDNDILVDEKSTPQPFSSVGLQQQQQQRSLSISSTSSSSSMDPKRRMTLSKADEELIQTPMIYAYGTVSFSIMDVSPPKQDTAASDKSKMMYIIQIERPAIQENNGSEGGGYVITRTYHDFDVFHSLMRLKHTKRITRLNLKLPLEVTKSWLQKSKSVIGIGNNNSNSSNNDIMGYYSNVNNSSSNNNSGVSISQGLEHYLHIVVADAELGRDPLILAFLRKERATERGTTQDELSFADEYKDELMAYNNNNSNNNTSSNLLVDTNWSLSPTMGNRAKSLFGRTTTTSIFGNTTSSPSTSIGSSIFSTEDMETEEEGEEKDNVKKPWKEHKITTRQGSISSLQSQRSSNGSESIETTNNNDNIKKINSQDTISTAISSLEKEPNTTITNSSKNNKPKHKPLSSMDTELLIETTFALIVESFNLTTANNKAWMRRSLLNLLREIVRRSYTELVAKQYNDYMEAYLSPDALVTWMTMIKDMFWPDQKEENRENKTRTDEEKEQTKQQAKLLLVQQAVPSGVRQLIGEQNCSLSMERIWYRLQDEEFNRVLVLQVMERVIRPLFN